MFSIVEKHIFHRVEETLSSFRKHIFIVYKKRFHRVKTIILWFRKIFLILYKKSSCRKTFSSCRIFWLCRKKFHCVTKICFYTLKIYFTQKHFYCTIQIFKACERIRMRFSSLWESISCNIWKHEIMTNKSMIQLISLLVQGNIVLYTCTVFITKSQKSWKLTNFMWNHLILHSWTFKNLFQILWKFFE